MDTGHMDSSKRTVSLFKSIHRPNDLPAMENSNTTVSLQWNESLMLRNRNHPCEKLNILDVVNSCMNALI